MRSSASIDPVRDWLLLLTVSGLILIGSIVWNMWAFGTVASGGTIGTVMSRSPTVFDNTSLEPIRTLFEKRATEEEKYTTGVYHFSDPSQ